MTEITKADLEAVLNRKPGTSVSVTAPGEVWFWEGPKLAQSWRYLGPLDDIIRLALKGLEVGESQTQDSWSHDEIRLPVGTEVSKCSGYRFDGTVVAAFRTLEGRPRFVVDNGDGMLHIFNGGQLSASPK